MLPTSKVLACLPRCTGIWYWDCIFKYEVCYTIKDEVRGEGRQGKEEEGRGEREKEERGERERGEGRREMERGEKGERGREGKKGGKETRERREKDKYILISSHNLETDGNTMRMAEPISRLFRDSVCTKN